MRCSALRIAISVVEVVAALVAQDAHRQVVATALTKLTCFVPIIPCYINQRAYAARCACAVSKSNAL